jgi:hypothetical protein
MPGGRRLYIERTSAAAARCCAENWSPTVDPLHARARAAIERLGLDGSRLELAVAVFGWGSDEANGSLLGLVRTAWKETTVAPVFDTESGMGWTYASGFDPWDGIDDSDHWPINDVELLHVVALEARQP